MNRPRPLMCPMPSSRFSTLLPSERMADALQTIWTKGHGLGDTGLDLPVLVLWALAALLIGARRFRWE